VTALDHNGIRRHPGLYRMCCERNFDEHSRCSVILFVAAQTEAEARAAAHARGWTTRPDGSDHCDTCSPRRPPTLATVHPLPTKDRRR